MQDTHVYLELIQERGRKGLLLERVYGRPIRQSCHKVGKKKQSKGAGTLLSLPEGEMSSQYFFYSLCLVADSRPYFATALTNEASQSSRKSITTLILESRMPGNWHVRFGGGTLEKDQQWHLVGFLSYTAIGTAVRYVGSGPNMPPVNRGVPSVPTG